jgi:hypothetical protein
MAELSTKDLSPTGMLEDARQYYNLGTHEAAFFHICDLQGLKRGVAQERFGEYEANPEVLPGVVRTGILELVLGISTT